MKSETLLLKQPTISNEHIAFLYAGEIWIAGLDGTNPLRLTSQKGHKTQPYFSPDGNLIAFSANYDGNMSVYCISKDGGSPKKLTYHPEEDTVRGWTPDGKNVLFSSEYTSNIHRKRNLFTVSLDGGLPVPLSLPMAERAAYSPDGKFIAYTQYMETFWTWKRYRGGMTLPIWVLDVASFDHVEIPHVNASDTFPCWAEQLGLFPL